MKKSYLLFLSLAAMFAMSVVFTSCDKDDGGGTDDDGNGTAPGSALTISVVNGNDFNLAIDKVYITVGYSSGGGCEMQSAPYKNGSFTVHLPTEKEMAVADEMIDKMNLLEYYFNEKNAPDPDLVTITGGGQNAMEMGFWPEKNNDGVYDLDLYRYLEVRDDDGYPVQTTRATLVYLFTDKMSINGEFTQKGEYSYRFEMPHLLKYSVELKKGWNWIFQIENYANRETVWTTMAPAADIPWYWYYSGDSPATYNSYNDLFKQYVVGEVSMHLQGKWRNSRLDDCVMEFKENGTFYCDDAERHGGYTTWEMAEEQPYNNDYEYNILIGGNPDDEEGWIRTVYLEHDEESGEINWDLMGYWGPNYSYGTLDLERIDEKVDNALKAKVEEWLVGTWETADYSDPTLYEFKANHTYTCTYRSGTTTSGTWFVKDGVRHLDDNTIPSDFRLDMEEDGSVDIYHWTFVRSDKLFLDDENSSDSKSYERQ